MDWGSGHCDWRTDRRHVRFSLAKAKGRQKLKRSSSLGKQPTLRSVRSFRFGRRRAFILRTEGGFLAISAVCPHLNCIVNWNEILKKFECPCHGAKFNQMGEVLEGPPPRPLDLYKLQIAAGNLVVDRASPIERSKFDPSQLVKG